MPVVDWLTQIKDRKIRITIQTRIDRLALGLTGNVKPLGKGLYELKIDLGPGYRVYFGYDGPHLIILLMGGDKSTQQKDIELSHIYWKHYQAGQTDEP